MRRTQIGWVIIVVALFVEILAFYQQITGTAFIILTTGMILMVLLFGTLTINVTNEFIGFYMGIGLIRGKYRFSDIAYCRPLSYIPLGWGIRFRPGVILFNVSGYKAIEIKRKNKNTNIWIGTSNPEEIVYWVNERMKKE
jgi:hypothetical protein